MKKAIIFAPCDLHELEFQHIRRLREKEGEPALCWDISHLTRLEGVSEFFYAISKASYGSSQYQNVYLHTWPLTVGKNCKLIVLDDVTVSPRAHPDSMAGRLFALPKENP